MDEIFRVGADTAEYAKDRLNEKRRLDHAPVEKMREIVEVADIIAFEFKTCAATLPQIFQDPLNILESVAKDKVPRHFQELRLPGMLPFLVPADHRIEPEIHRPHIERAHLGLGAQWRGKALFEAHAMPAARRDVDDGASRLLDPREKLHEYVRVGGRPSVFWIAGVKMQNRRPRLRRSDRIARDLVRSQRQKRAHRRSMDRAGNGAGDDDLAAKRHPHPSLKRP